MIKIKDGYAKLIGTTYSGSVSRVLLSNGGDHILGNSNGNIPLNNGTVNTNLNADMLDGLHIHAGRNNEVNKIVRTDISGYILAGWINTTSGDIGAGAINKIYCSNDNYIRYKTPANFFPTLANSGNDISITVAGLNRKLTVGYATNTDTVDGEHASNFSYTHQTSFDFSKSKSGRIVTFDQSGTDYGWINGFASTHSNYLTSVLFNAHRTSNWYVGYIEGNTSTGKTNGLLAVHKLAFVDLIPTSLKNPHSLTLKANGTILATYDGSSAKEANFTYANVGAAPASHTHTYIVAEDLRAKYPGLILDPQRMKLSFLAASTLGIKNDGSYYDVITVRSYADSSGGSDNALLFSKNSNSLYHTRFAFGSTSSWGSPLLIIDSGNIGSQSVAYASKAGSVAWDSITGKPSSFTPSSHTHSWTSITDKLVAGNEFNIVNAGFNADIWFNYKPINDSSKTASIHTYIMGNGAKGMASVTASGFIKKGSNSNYVLLGDGGHKAISDFATSGHTHSSITIPICSSLDGNSDIFRVEYAVGSNSVATKPRGVDAFGVMKLRTASGWYGLILMSANTAPGIYYRNANGLTSSVNWIKLLDSSNSNVLGGGNTWGSSITVNINGTSKTLTIPNNPNTDYRVTQSETTTSNYRPLVVGYTNVSTAGSGMTGSVTNQVYLSNKFYVQPSTGNLYATNFVGALSGNATTATNADKLDGIHANGLLTALSNSNNGISITVGGTTKSVSNISVNYASSAGSVAWDNVTGKPSTFAPSAHTHKWADITDHITKLSLLTNDTGFVTGSVSGNTITINGNSTTWSNTWRPITDDYELGESGTSLSSLGSLTLYNDLLDSIPNPTNYYWANVKISASSSTTTSPTVSNLTATSSIRMGNIYLLNTNEINSASGIHLNYQNSGNISLCYGGGNVGIGTMSPTYKLDVNGNIHSSGTINCNALNVGSTLSIKDSVISCSASNISIESKESGSLLINSREVLSYNLDRISMTNKTQFVHRLGLGASSPDPITNIHSTDDVTVYIGSLTESSSFEFRPAMDGLLLFLKIGKLHSNTYFWCTAKNCEVIRANNFSTYLNKNQNKDCFGDGCARIFIYKLITERWYEFYCG